MLKRLIAAFLCLTMMVTMLPAQAFAEEEEHIHTEESQETTAPEETAAPETTEAVTESAVETEAVEKTTAAETEESVPEETVSEETEVPETTAATEGTEAVEETLPEVSQEAAMAASGSCGANTKWSLTDAGVLTISGTGAVTNDQGWRLYYADDITSVVIKSGVTSICDTAFYGCDNLKTVTIPASITTIEYGAFWYCSSLEEVRITDLAAWCAIDFGSAESVPEGKLILNGKAITALEIPSGATKISPYAFCNIEGITSVTIPDSVTSIGHHAFEYQRNLKTLTLGKGVKEIGEYAFYSCALSSIKFPEGLLTIGDYAFYMTYLENVTIPASVTSIGKQAFAVGGSMLQKIQVAAGNRYYASDNAGVLHDKNMTTVLATPYLRGSYTVTDTVTTIGDNAFANLAYLSKVTLPEGLTTIGKSAFSGCDRLTEIVLPASVTSIGESAFYGCEKLTSITIPANTVSIGDRAFNGCSTMTAIWAAEGNPNYASDASGVLFDKNMTTLIRIPVGFVGAYTVPDSVTEIAPQAAISCSGLTGITFGANLTTIGAEAFRYCTGLTEISFSADAPKIDVTAFGGVTASVHYPLDNATWNWQVMNNYGGALTWEGPCKDGHTEVTEPGTPATCTESGIQDYRYCSVCGKVFSEKKTLSALGHKLEGDACTRCGGHVGSCGSSLKWYLSADGVLTISGTGKMTDWETSGSAPWYNYRDSILRVVIEDGVTSIGEYAFYDCDNMVSAQIPDSVVVIEYGAFYYCEALRDVTIPSKAVSIGNVAFGYCEALETVTIPASVTNLGSTPFYSCNALTEIRVDPGNAYYASDDAGAMYNKQMTTLLQVPAGMSGEYTVAETTTVIGDSAFYHCSGVTAVHIGKNVKTIEEAAFFGCGVTSMTIPNNVTSLGSLALVGSNKLETLVIGNGVKTIPEMAFLNCYSLKKIIIGSGVTSVDALPFYGCEELSDVRFLGNAPTFKSDSFYNVSGIVYYPSGNSTWTSSVRQQYSGSVTWVPMCGGGHTPVSDPGVAPTCTKPGRASGTYCDMCTRTISGRQELPAKGHTSKSVAAVEPTCTETGLSAGTVCKECGIILSGQTVVAPKGHTPVIVPGYPNTCTTDGLSDGSFCDVCGDLLATQEVIPAAHARVTDPAVEVSCDEAGLTEGSHCSACGMVFVAQQTIPALGHNFVNNTCSRCGGITGSCGSLAWVLSDEELTISGTGAIPDYGMGSAPWYANRNSITSVTIGPDVTAIGSNAFSYCTALTTITFAGNAPTISETAFSRVVADAYYTYNSTWTANALQNYGGTITWHGDCGGSHVLVAIAGTAATCTTTGMTDGSYCFACGTVVAEQQTIPVLGHNLGSWTTTKDATCTIAGTQRRDCSRCDHYETQTIPATGHTQQTIPAVAATCTTSGLTEGKKCSVCGVTITAQKTVAALGHGYNNWTTTVAATCTTNGSRYRACTRCDYDETQTIYATGHREKILSSISATCTASGLTEGKVCSVCGVTITAQQTVAALGHSYGNWETTTGATCTTDGQERRDCIRCDHYETQTIYAVGHTEQILSAVAPTCTQTGLTEGKKCSVCQEILTAQGTVPARGHDYVNFLCRSCGEYAQGGGSIGENLTWDVDTGSGQLTITGSGSLETPAETPWAGYEEAIREILISAGVTDIAPDVFGGCDNLTDILVDDSNRSYADQDGILFTTDGTELVKYPGGRSDAEYTVPGTVDRIGDNAFSGCEALDTLYFTDSMPAFEENAFAGADLTIYYPGGDSSWNPEKLKNYGGNITWIPQYDQPEVLSITADRQSLGMNGQAVLTANLNMQSEETKVLWELAPGDEAWVHLTPSGNTARLTAKTVLERTTVTVTARTKDGMAAPARITIAILPPVSSVALLDEDGRDAAGKTIWWDLNSDRTQMTFTAQVQPTDAPGEVDWRVGDTAGTYAKCTIDGNILTLSDPTGKTGTLDIQVIAMDGSGVNAKFTVKFTSLKPETEGSEEADPADLTLLSEKSKQLTVYDGETGKALTNKQITWSMDEVYAPYAKIDAKGKLTAKKVVEKVRVEAVGSIIGSEGTTVTLTVDIYPAVTLVELAQDGVSVNNKTLTVNYSGEPLVLTANSYPLDAMEGVTWTISDKKEAYASYVIEGSVLTIEPKEGTKAGSVTIKATSDDGSKKTATVKLQLAAYAETVTIDRSVTELTAGDKAIQLTAAMEPAVVTKPGIVWSLKNADDKNYVNLSSSGKITPKNVLAPAEVVIVATSKDGMASDEYTIKVWPKSEAQLVLRDEAGNYVTKTTQTLDVNTQKSITLSAHTYGEEKLTSVTWSPLTNKTAKITENADGSLTIQMIAAGSINVTAKAEDGRKATVTIKGVKQAQSVRIAEKKTDKREGLEVASGKSLDLVATLTDAANKKVTWSITEGSAYATVASSGKVTAAKDVTTAGKVVVRATAADGSGVYDELEIVVRPIAQGVQVYSEAGGHMLFSFRSQQWWVRSNTTLTWDLSTQGNTIAIDAHVFPYYGADNSKNAIQSVIGKSSAPKVAKLVYTDDGKVQLQVLGTGSTTVTVTAGDGSNQKVSFKLNVVRTVTDLTLEDQTVAGGKSLNLAKLVTINPSDATNKKLTWTITKGSAYATISSSGSFKAKKVTSSQKVEVTVTAQDGSETSTTCIVTIDP